MSGKKRKTGYVTLTRKGPAHYTIVRYYEWGEPLGLTFCGRYYKTDWVGARDKPEARICKACFKSIAYKVRFPEAGRKRKSRK
jgi:hypothetical protein